MATRPTKNTDPDWDRYPGLKPVFDALTAEQLVIYNAIVDEKAKIAYLQQVSKGTTTTATETGTTATGSEPGLTQEQLAEIGRQALFGATATQKAFGGVGSRQLDPKTGQPIEGSYRGLMIPGVDGGPEREPLYFAGDENQIRSLTPEQIAQLQADLEKLGRISKYRVGVVDSVTLDAFTKLLGEANVIGTDWATALTTLGNAPSRGGSPGGLGARRANPDDLKRVFRRASQSTLGYALDESELNRMVGAFQQQASGGAPQTAEGFAETQIRKQRPEDAEAYDFASFAMRFLGGGSGG